MGKWRIMSANLSSLGGNEAINVIKKISSLSTPGRRVVLRQGLKLYKNK